MSAAGQERRSEGASVTSGLPPRADVVGSRHEVSKVPIGDIALAGTLDFGPSDHKPIVLELQVATAAVKRHPLQRARRSLAKIRAALR